MTKEGQKNHNFPHAVRLWGRYDFLPSSCTLEYDMKKAEQAKQDAKSNDKNQHQSVNQSIT